MQTGYNGQIVVDNKKGIIIAVDVTQEANDQNQLVPMIKQTRKQHTRSIKADNKIIRTVNALYGHTNRQQVLQSRNST